MFALQTPSGVYSPLFPGYLGSPQPFTQTSAPVRTGTGSVIDPWTVTSTFDATSSLHITQTVAHVDGTTEFLGTWAVHNTGGGSVNLKAFEGGDLYVSENDNGIGSLVGTSPNRIAQSVATDGSAAELIEQPGAPWSHYFTGDNGPFYNAVAVDSFNHLPTPPTPPCATAARGASGTSRSGRRHEHRVGDVALRAAQPSAGSRPRKAPPSSLTDKSAAPSFATGRHPARRLRVQPGFGGVRGVHIARQSCRPGRLPAHLQRPGHQLRRPLRPVDNGGVDVGADPTPTPTPTPMPRRTPDAPADATPTAPPACVSARAMRLHWTVPERSRLGAFSVTANGRSIATLAATRRAYTLSLRGVRHRRSPCESARGHAPAPGSAPHGSTPRAPSSRSPARSRRCRFAVCVEGLSAGLRAALGVPIPRIPAVGFSPSHTHLRNTMRKLEASTRVQAVAIRAPRRRDRRRLSDASRRVLRRRRTPRRAAGPSRRASAGRRRLTPPTKRRLICSAS